jgi:hypothetical protein
MTSRSLSVLVSSLPTEDPTNAPSKVFNSLIGPFESFADSVFLTEEITLRDFVEFNHSQVLSHAASKCPCTCLTSCDAVITNLIFSISSHSRLNGQEEQRREANYFSDASEFTHFFLLSMGPPVGAPEEIDEPFHKFLE